MRRRNKWGYTDMGRARIPPLPQGIILTDRDDGTLWLLSHNITEASVDDLGYISITDTIPSRMDTRTYGPYEGPILGAHGLLVRLLVRGGYLGMEQTGEPAWTLDIDDGRLLTRRGNANETREVITPSGWQGYPSVIGWSPVEF